MANSCDLMRRWVEAGEMEFNDYAYNVTLRAVGGGPGPSMKECLDSVSADLLLRYGAYLRDWLLPVDFMPDPQPFMVGRRPLQEVEDKKNALRPKYVEIYQYVQSRINRM